MPRLSPNVLLHQVILVSLTRRPMQAEEEAYHAEQKQRQEEMRRALELEVRRAEEEVG